MGRIADALKRAEQERRHLLGVADRQEGDSEAAPRPPFSAPTAEVSIATTPEGASNEPRPVVEGLYESLVPFFERSSLITEQYRSLRTRLLSQNPNYEHRIFAISSPVPKEGKSVTALNLARILAEIRHLNVLVVDADFRRSSLARMLNQSKVSGPGLAEVLRGEATYSQALRKTPVENLSFMSAGKTGDHSAAELLTAAQAGPLFKRMQDEFHYTIVDTPPATTVPDIGIIGQWCSGVIMVVRLHRTDEVAARRSVRLLQVNNIPIIGCLLIGRDTSTGRYGYGYGYAYNYYRHYDYYSKHDEES